MKFQLMMVMMMIDKQLIVNNNYVYSVLFKLFVLTCVAKHAKHGCLSAQTIAYVISLLSTASCHLPTAIIVN